MTATLRAVLGDIHAGSSITRALLNERVRSHVLTGKVLDVGAPGVGSYVERMDRRQPLELESVDLAFPEGSPQHVDLERDPLPHADGVFDQVLLFNLLEHIYDHRHVLGEARRVLRDGGQLLGFTPFLLQYHPDPHDYFRYTREGLERLLSDADFTDVSVEEVGRGPFAANCVNVMFAVPRVLRAPLVAWYWSLDAVFLALRPGAKVRYPLGYLFAARR